MAEIVEVIAKFRMESGSPSRPEQSPFRLASSVSEPAVSDEIQSAWQGSVIPEDVSRLWKTCRSARLFEDVDFGQWGLALLDPWMSVRRTHAELRARPQDFASSDVVIGEFLGDQELLVVAPTETGTRRVLVALPLDSRSDWFGAASDLADFLDKYHEARGFKYWER